MTARLILAIPMWEDPKPLTEEYLAGLEPEKFPSMPETLPHQVALWIMPRAQQQMDHNMRLIAAMEPTSFVSLDAIAEGVATWFLYPERLEALRTAIANEFDSSEGTDLAVPGYYDLPASWTTRMFEVMDEANNPCTVLTTTHLRMNGTMLAAVLTKFYVRGPQGEPMVLHAKMMLTPEWILSQDMAARLLPTNWLLPLKGV